jgi:hypothetical protein
MILNRILILSFSWFFFGCNNNPATKKTNDTTLHDSVVDSCNGLDVDTSVAGINLCDSESFTEFVGEENKFCEGETYCFASKDGYQELKLTAHPGNSQNSICEFEILNTRLTGSKHKKLLLDSFVTGKGIYLGMKKEELVRIFGNCYTSKINYNETLVYRIQSPRDTKTRLLKSLNYPAYYAEYYIIEGYVAKIKFGLEYP